MIAETMIVHSSFSEINRTQWENLVASSPSASFFQTPECYEFYAGLSFLKPFVFAVTENKELKGLLCGYIISNGNRFSAYLSRRAIVCGGVLLDSSISEEALKAMLRTAAKTLKKKAIYIEIRNYTDYSEYKSVFRNAGFSYLAHLNFHVSTPDVVTALQNLNTTKRRHIKISTKEGVEWSETTDLNDVKAFYDILQDLYKTKVKRPLFPIEFFEKIVLDSVGKLLIVRYQNRVIGGMICVILPDNTLYEWFVCGEERAGKNVYSSEMATWAGIEYAAKNNIPRFDFMGAGKPENDYGVREFKSKFGGCLVENGRFLFICNPFLYSIGKTVIENPVLKRIIKIV